MTPPHQPFDFAAEGSRSDRYRDWDAAYVLGALSPSERREFEEHLAGCGDCREAVSELAGMPGLLAQVSAEEAADLGSSAATAGGSGIDDTMPETLRAPRVARPGRRRRVNPAMLALAASFALLVGVADVVPVAGGTELNVECLYGDDDPGRPLTRPRYEIVVLDRQGHPTPVRSWPVRPNHLMTPSGKSSLPVSKIGSLEIRTAAGKPLLRANLR